MEMIYRKWLHYFVIVYFLYLGTLDFELQALILEMVFRLIPPSERDSYASTWFDCKELQQLFASIEDKCFEPVSNIQGVNHAVVLSSL